MTGEGWEEKYGDKIIDTGKDYLIQGLVSHTKELN